jgi:hypothetical protein
MYCSEKDSIKPPNQSFLLDSEYESSPNDLWRGGENLI